MIAKIRQWIAEHVIFSIFVGGVVFLFFLGLLAWWISNLVEKYRTQEMTTGMYIQSLQKTEDDTVEMIKKQDYNIQMNIGNNLWGE